MRPTTNELVGMHSRDVPTMSEEVQTVADNMETERGDKAPASLAGSGHGTVPLSAHHIDSAEVGPEAPRREAPPHEISSLWGLLMAISLVAFWVLVIWVLARILS